MKREKDKKKLIKGIKHYLKFASQRAKQKLKERLNKLNK